MKKITKNTTLEEIFRIKGAEDVLAKFNLPCLSCPMASFEMGRLKIGEVAKVYNLDLKNLLKELNKLTK